MSDPDEQQQQPQKLPYETPALMVQRMGKKWRIVYSATRSLARFNSGQPVDEGGFLDERDEAGNLVVDGQLECSKVMAAAIERNKPAGVAWVDDPEAESIGH